MLERLSIDLIQHRDITDALLRDIVSLKAEHWHYPTTTQLDWINANISSDDYHLLIKDLKLGLIGYLNLVNRRAEVDDRSVELFGIGNVCVRLTLKDRKLGKLLMEMCRFHLSRLQRAGVLLCKDHLVPFYTKSGWARFGGSVLISREPFNNNLLFSDTRFQAVNEVRITASF